MGHFSVEIYALPGSLLSSNQQPWPWTGVQSCDEVSDRRLHLAPVTADRQWLDGLAPGPWPPLRFLPTRHPHECCYDPDCLRIALQDTERWLPASHAPS